MLRKTRGALAEQAWYEHTQKYEQILSHSKKVLAN